MQEAHRCPEDVLGWIPWYPDQGLEPDQQSAVEAHAASCARCRAEIALVVGEVQVADPLSTDAVLESVLARVRRGESSATHAAAGRAAPSRARPGWRRGALQVLAAAVFAGVCAAAGAVGVLALRDAGEPVYTTAADAAPPAAAADAPLLDVVFRDGVDAGRIRASLRAVNGQIVSGPTELGRYRVRLGPGADPRAAAQALASGDAGVAVYAEPVPR